MTACVLLVVVAIAAWPGGSRATGYSINAIDTTHVPPFSGENAHVLLEQQVAFGPRVAGTPGHAAQLAWMTQYLAERADTVTVQPFEHRHDTGRVLRMSNVFARFNTTHRDRILLVAHWDTRPTADMDSARTTEPIPGANDGASGTAVLLEIANILSSNMPPIGVDILLVDGEDYGPGERNMYLGAKHFAANQPQGFRPLYGILLDMIGDANPLFYVEGNSNESAPEVVRRVWGVAYQLGYSTMFPSNVGTWISDDHVYLNRAGIRTINIIDFDYGPGNSYWHTHRDVVEHTSAVGLGAVGKVLLTLIWNRG